MQLIDRILTILNELVILLWQIFLHTLYVLTPTFLRRIFRRIKLVGGFLLKKIVVGQKILGLSIIVFAKKIIAPFLRFEKAFQESIEKVSTEIRSIKISDLTPTKILGKIIQIYVVFFQSILHIWKMTWGNMSNQTIATICGLFFICILASLKIYQTSSQLYFTLTYNGRKPASAFELESKLKARPVYYKQENRHYDIKQLRIPVYIESERSLRIFEIDATIESSNRFVTRFFSEHENFIRDRLLSTTEPMIHSFPFSDEGKRVMKEKITQELMRFIRENKIEGEVKEVYFNGIVAL